MPPPLLVRAAAHRSTARGDLDDWARADAYRYVGARLLPVPVTANGMNVELAAELLERASARLIYVMPTFHNPTGTVLPTEARRRLVALAERHDALIVEDDTFGEIELGASPPPPLASLDPDGRVLLIGS